MTFTIPQIKRFYQVYFQDSLTTVGRFTLEGTLVAQLGDGAGETKVCESGSGMHAEVRFLSGLAKNQITTVPNGSTLRLTIKITYSPCSKCRTALKDFFSSLPQGGNSRYSLCIQFAYLYHEKENSTDMKKNSTDDEIKNLAAWSRSLEDINVNTVFEPVNVTKDPEFNPTCLGITDEKVKEREMKDKQVSGYVQQIMKQIMKQKKAHELNKQGNASLQTGDVATAIKLYTKAIDLYPTNHVLYSNRSIAFCREKKYEDALKDANYSIALNAYWTEGHCCKGAAYMHLNQFSAAASAYTQALRIEPGNQNIKDALALAAKEAELEMTKLFAGTSI